jgi:hypothetical protein
MRIKTSSRESGLAVLLVLLLLVMMFGFIGMNAAAIAGLKREIKLVERRQLKIATNAPVATAQEISK